MTGIFSEKNSYFTQNRVNEPFLDPKSTLLNISINLVIRFFWNCTWWYEIKNNLKWLIIYYAQNGVNGTFWGRKSLLLYLMTGIKNWFKVTVFDFEGNLILCPKSTLYSKSVHGFFQNYSWWQVVKSGLKGPFCILKENSYYTQNGVNEPVVRTRVLTAGLIQNS